MRRLGAVLAAGAVLVACERTREVRPDLALACQTVPCVCVEARATVLRKDATAPVLWRRNGDAYCPEGFVLRREGR